MSQGAVNAQITDILTSTKPLVESLQKTTLRTLLSDAQRSDSLIFNFDGITADFSRQFLDQAVLDKFELLAQAIKPRIEAMFNGERINSTENRAVLHMALRANASDTFLYEGHNVVPQVLEVQKQIERFSKAIRAGELKGLTGKPLVNILAVGIGGSYLGAKFVHEALRKDTLPVQSNGTSQSPFQASQGRKLRFLANVDPNDFHRATEDLDPTETLVLILSKTFTTTETMVNAGLALQWLVQGVSAAAKTATKQDIVGAHMAAVSTAVDKVIAFGIEKSRIFGFDDWVGGRYSVTSAVGLLPLALQYGWEVVEQFLKGARSADQLFRTVPVRHNLPMMLGMVGVVNSSLLHFPARALAPYSEALVDLAAHIQQVDMESNGKSVRTDGSAPEFSTGEIDFGQPGTNAQHSFFQLFHQGRTVPVDFIGHIQSQCANMHTVDAKMIHAAHHELMCNFFAQPDALAEGQSIDELLALGVSPSLAKQKLMPGNRPSTTLLLTKLTAYEVGQLLAIYEHRTAVQGFIWGLNSFDQFGVELGKVLAGKVRSFTSDHPVEKNSSVTFNPSTKRLLEKYVSARL